MGIKEVEHHAVYKSKKKVSLLMKYKKYMDITKQVYINLLKHKIYKKASMEAFNHYNTLANGKKNYLNNAKKKFKKWKALKILRRDNARNIHRTRKMLRSIPFPLSFSTYFRKKIKIKKPKKLNILSYNRILKINRIYDKFNKKFYYNKNGKLKRIKKKKKKIFKLKFNLWNSLINVNYSKHINYINKSLINLDQFNFLPSIQLNYILKLKNKMGIKYNKIVFTIFKQYKKSFLSNFYKVNMINKIKCYYNANINDNFIYICSSLKNIIYNTFYNKVFYINYDFNYLKSFYQFLQSKLLNNVLFTIKVKNYNNFLLLLGGKSSESFDVIIKRNNVINNYKKKNNLNHLYNKIYKIVKKFTANLIKKKKFTRHAIAKINLLFLKKLIFNNTKFNIIVNDKLKLFDNSAKVNYNMFSTFLNERPIKIKRYNFYFYRFVKKNLIMQKNILKKYHKYNYYITKKYHFLISFIKYYLRQLFYGLKYIFYKGLNNFNKFLLKLKLLFISIYYMLFVRFIKPFIKKKTKKLLNSNKVFTYNIMVTYKKAIKTWWKKRKGLIIKKKVINDIDKYTQPWNLFRYNPLLNPKHNLWVRRKKNRQKRVFNIIRRKIRSYLTWYKWESRRQFYKKYYFKRLKALKFKKKSKYQKRLILLKRKRSLKLKLLKLKIIKKFKFSFFSFNKKLKKIKKKIKSKRVYNKNSFMALKKNWYNKIYKFNYLASLKLKQETKKKKKVRPFFYLKLKKKRRKKNIKNIRIKSLNFYKKQKQQKHLRVKPKPYKNKFNLK